MQRRRPWLSKLRSAIFGAPRLRLVKIEKSLSPSVQLSNKLGHQINLYCVTRIYSLTYVKIKFFKKPYMTFSIFGTGSIEIPDKLREILAETIVIPALLPFYYNRHDQKQEAIMAYVSHVMDVAS